MKKKMLLCHGGREAQATRDPPTRVAPAPGFSALVSPLGKLRGRRLSCDQEEGAGSEDLGLSPAVPLQVPGCPAPACVALRITALLPLPCLDEGSQGAGSVPLEGVHGAKPFSGSGLQGNGASLWAWGGKAAPAPPGAAPAETGLPESHSTSLLGGPLGTQARGVHHPRAQFRTEQHVRGWRAEISGVGR